ncbi:MAG TPA: AsnC family protein [Amycolatopsis sp.]
MTDPVDIRLLAALADLGKTAVHELAAKVGMDPREVAYRLVALSGSGLPLLVGVESDPSGLRAAISAAPPSWAQPGAQQPSSGQVPSQPPSGPVASPQQYPSPQQSQPHQAQPPAPQQFLSPRQTQSGQALQHQQPGQAPQQQPQGGQAPQQPMQQQSGQAPHPPMSQHQQQPMQQQPQSGPMQQQPGQGFPVAGPAMAPFSQGLGGPAQNGPGGPAVHGGPSGAHAVQGTPSGAYPGAPQPGAASGPYAGVPGSGSGPYAVQGHHAPANPLVSTWGVPQTASWARGDEPRRTGPPGGRQGRIGEVLATEGLEGEQLTVQLLEVQDPADYLFGAAGYRLEEGERSVVVHTEITNRGSVGFASLPDNYLELVTEDGATVGKAPVSLTSRPPHKIGVRPGETLGGHTVYILPDAIRVVSVRWSPRPEPDDRTLTWAIEF